MLYLKVLILTFLISGMPLVLAGDRGGDPYEDKILFLAGKEVQLAVAELAESINKCRSQKGHLSVSLFENLEISLDDLATALVYLSMKAQRKCEQETRWKNFAFSLGKLRSIQRHYNRAAHEKFEYEELIHGNAWRDTKLELQYKEIDSKYRAVLEKMPELSRPFKPLSKIKELERLKKPSRRPQKSAHPAPSSG